MASILLESPRRSRRWRPFQSQEIFMNIANIGIKATAHAPAPAPAAAARVDGDGDRDGSGGADGDKDGRLTASLQGALSKLGIGGAATTGAPGASQQALQSFTQALFGALHAQASGQAGSGAAPAAGYQDHRHGGGQLAGSLRSLATALAARGHGNSAGNSAVAALQSSFDALSSANGQAPGSADLIGFVRTLADGVGNAGTSGAIAASTV
jgi:hypothetical protein